MHILFITEFFPDLDNPIFSGGVETRMYYAALHLAKKHTVTVIARRKKLEVGIQKLEEIIESAQDRSSWSLAASQTIGSRTNHNSGNLTIYRLGYFQKSSSATIFSLFSRVLFIFQAFFAGLKIDADIVEGSNYVVFLPAFLIAKIKNIPAVAWYPDVLIGHWRQQFGIILGTIGEISERFFARLPWDHCITISKTAKQRLLKTGFPSDKISVIACGVDTTHNLKITGNQQLTSSPQFSQDFQHTIVKQSSINRKSSLKYDQLLVISRLVAYKRIDWAINLLHSLHQNKNFKKLRLVIIGSGPQLSKLQSLVKNLQLTNQVIFKHHVTTKQLQFEIAKSKLLLHPSLIEGFGIVLVESSALGTPYIAADIPTSKEIHKQLQSGFLFERNNFLSFTQVVTQALTDDATYQILQKNGFRNAQKYDWADLGKQTEMLYKQIIRTL